MIHTLPKSLIETAKKVLTESAHPLLGRLKNMVDSGRYEIANHSEDDRYHRYVVHAVRPDNAKEFIPREGKHPDWYNPDMATLHTPYPDEPFARTYATLKLETGYKDHVDAEMKPGVIYRGMSHEEYENIMKTGKIKTKGDYNLEGQEGLTYFSRDPSQAQSYAHSFAPPQHKATGKHNAYVVAVKDPGTDVCLPGVGECEVGIPHAIDAKGIVGVWEGKAYSGTAGMHDLYKGWSGLEEGSSSTPMVSVGWKQIHGT